MVLSALLCRLSYGTLLPNGYCLTGRGKGAQRESPGVSQSAGYIEGRIYTNDNRQNYLSPGIIPLKFQAKE